MCDNCSHDVGCEDLECDEDCDGCQGCDSFDEEPVQFITLHRKIQATE